MYFPQEIFELIKEYFMTEYYKLREYVSQNPKEIYEYFDSPYSRKIKIGIMGGDF